MDVVNGPDIIMNESTHRFELTYNDDIAYIDYRWYNKTLILLYIFVPVPFRGKGLSTKLIEYALKYAREKEVKIKVFCPYISKYIRMHPEHEDLLEQ
ncbi:MAG: GNAT family N-acetyltransferase [Saprospiraceae bacterium]